MAQVAAVVQTRSLVGELPHAIGMANTPTTTTILCITYHASGSHMGSAMQLQSDGAGAGVTSKASLLTFEASESLDLSRGC